MAKLLISGSSSDRRKHRHIMAINAGKQPKASLSKSFHCLPMRSTMQNTHFKSASPKMFS